MLILALLPVLLIYLVNPHYRIYSRHGLMHVSIVNQVLVHGVPPEAPWLAGQPLAYPWAYHVLVAGMRSLLYAPASVCFAAINLVCLTGTVVLLSMIAGLITPDRRTRCFAVLLALFGMTPFCRGPITHVLKPLFARWVGSPLLVPGVPAVEKFSNVNATPLGIFFTAWFFYLTLQLLAGGSRPWWRYALLFLAVVGAGYFYPLMFLGLGVCTGLGGLLALMYHGRRCIPAVLAYAGCAAAAALVVAPYVLEIASARTAHHPGLQASWAGVGHNCLRWLGNIGVVLLIAAWEYRRVGGLIRPVHFPWLLLVVFGMVLGGMYAVLSVPPRNEYKFMMQSALCLGVAGSVLVAGFVQRSRFIALPLLTLLLLTFGSDLWARIGHPRPATPLVETGAGLRHRDPERNALYTWIANETPSDAVFVDTDMWIPVLGRRSLLVGLHVTHPGAGKPDLAGWTIPPLLLLVNIFGYPPDLVESRAQLVQSLYAAGPIEETTIAALRRAGASRPVYVVYAPAFRPDRLRDDPRFDRVYEHARYVVYRLRDDVGDTTGPAW